MLPLLLGQRNRCRLLTAQGDGDVANSEQESRNWCFRNFPMWFISHHFPTMSTPDFICVYCVCIYIYRGAHIIMNLDLLGGYDQTSDMLLVKLVLSCSILAVFEVISLANVFFLVGKRKLPSFQTPPKCPVPSGKVVVKPNWPKQHRHSGQVGVQLWSRLLWQVFTLDGLA